VSPEAHSKQILPKQYILLFIYKCTLLLHLPRLITMFSNKGFLYYILVCLYTGRVDVPKIAHDCQANPHRNSQCHTV